LAAQNTMREDSQRHSSQWDTKFTCSLPIDRRLKLSMSTAIGRRALENNVMTVPTYIGYLSIPTDHGVSATNELPVRYRSPRRR